MNRKHSFFVTGTDTEIGKTLVACALLQTFCARGLRTAAMKPIAAGATWRDDAWRNEDMEKLASAANITLPPEWTTPYLLTQATAPHIAGAQQGVHLDIERIGQCYAKVAQAADCVVVEGVGGFCVPLNDTQDTADLAGALNLPVILVVGLRLGCLSHALLTAEAISTRKLNLAGWVANHIDRTLRYTDHMIDTLHARLLQAHHAPLLGRIPYLSTPCARTAAPYLNLASIGF